MSCAAGITNEKLYRKAETHFNNREWNEAMMMYDVLLQKTDLPSSICIVYYCVVKDWSFSVGNALYRIVRKKRSFS